MKNNLAGQKRTPGRLRPTTDLAMEFNWNGNMAAKAFTLPTVVEFREFTVPFIRPTTIEFMPVGANSTDVATVSGHGVRLTGNSGVHGVPFGGTGGSSAVKRAGRDAVRFVSVSPGQPPGESPLTTTARASAL